MSGKIRQIFCHYSGLTGQTPLILPAFVVINLAALFDRLRRLVRGLFAATLAVLVCFGLSLLARGGGVTVDS